MGDETDFTDKYIFHNQCVSLSSNMLVYNNNYPMTPAHALQDFASMLVTTQSGECSIRVYDHKITDVTRAIVPEG